MAKLETVKVKGDTKSGFMIINKSDFDESKHEIFGGDNGEKKQTQPQATEKKPQTRRRRNKVAE